MDQADNQMLKISLAEIKQRLMKAQFVAALSDYPKIFDNVYINMVGWRELRNTGCCFKQASRLYGVST